MDTTRPLSIPPHVEKTREVLVYTLYTFLKRCKLVMFNAYVNSFEVRILGDSRE